MVLDCPEHVAELKSLPAPVVHQAVDEPPSSLQDTVTVGHTVTADPDNQVNVADVDVDVECSSVTMVTDDHEVVQLSDDNLVEPEPLRHFAVDPCGKARNNDPHEPPPELSSEIEQLTERRDGEVDLASTGAVDDSNQSMIQEAPVTSTLEQHKKLQIVLSRLPAPTDDHTLDDDGVTKVSPRPPDIPLEFSSDKPKRHRPTKSSVTKAVTSSATSKIFPPKKRFSAKSKSATKRKKHSKGYSPLKIKIPFLTRKLLTVESDKKSIPEDPLVDFETTERAAAEATSKKMQEESRLNSEAELILRREDPRFAKPTIPSTPDGSDDSCSDEEYEFRPVRAAAVAAMRKIDTDPDGLKGRKTGTWSPKPSAKGKGRRTMQKRSMVHRGIRRSVPEEETSSTTLVQSLFLNSTYFQLSDIVALERTFGTYFAQILNLIRFSDMTSFAEVAYLVPTTPCEAYPFEPDNYERRDDILPVLINLEEATFVTHFPFNYYNRSYRPPPFVGPQNVEWPMFKNMYDVGSDSDIEVKVEASPEDKKDSGGQCQPEEVEVGSSDDDGHDLKLEPGEMILEEGQFSPEPTGPRNDDREDVLQAYTTLQRTMLGLPEKESDQY